MEFKKQNYVHIVIVFILFSLDREREREVDRGRKLETEYREASIETITDLERERGIDKRAR